jgi:hypothetical protein
MRARSVPMVQPIGTICPPLPSPQPVNPSVLYGGYPPLNPTDAWSGFAPPPTGCVYGVDGITQSWVPVVTRWEVNCLVAAGIRNTVPEAPRDGQDYVRNGLAAQWVPVNDLILDGGVYT